jgi:hypothetical protein
MTSKAAPILVISAALTFTSACRGTLKEADRARIRSRVDAAVIAVDEMTKPKGAPECRIYESRSDSLSGILAESSSADMAIAEATGYVARIGPGISDGVEAVFIELFRALGAPAGERDPAQLAKQIPAAWADVEVLRVAFKIEVSKLDAKVKEGLNSVSHNRVDLGVCLNLTRYYPKEMNRLVKDAMDKLRARLAS